MRPISGIPSRRRVLRGFALPSPAVVARWEAASGSAEAPRTAPPTEASTPIVRPVDERYDRPS